MQPHTSYKVKVGLVALLLLLLITEVVIDPDNLFKINVSRPAQPDLSLIDRANQILQPSSYSQYANAVTNNIFHVDEVQPVAEVQEPVEIKQPAVQPFAMNLEITGIVITPGNEMVMIWDKQKRESHVLLKNEKLNQWQIDYIDKDKVELVHDTGKRYEFILNEEPPSDTVE